MLEHENPLKPDLLRALTIDIIEPLAETLGGTEGEREFSLSLLDVVRFSGHACPSVAGAFLVVRAAIRALFPENHKCLRGSVSIEVPSACDHGATGPIAHVFSYVTGAWDESGFNGLSGGLHRRSGLLRYSSPDAPSGGYRFTRRDPGYAVDVFYRPQALNLAVDPQWGFQRQWRFRVEAILANADQVIEVAPVTSAEPGRRP